MNRSHLLLLGLCTACAGSRHDDLSMLRPGRFVEAKGAVVDGRLRIDELDEVPRGTDDKADKVEVTAPVQAATTDTVRVLDQDFAIDGDTDHEDAEKRTIAPFTPASGDWLRIKARRKDDGLRARTLRQTPARDQWKVTGEVRSVDLDRGLLDLGGIVLPFADTVDVTIAGHRDPQDPLSLFLADDQKAVPFSWRIGESLRLGGQVAANLEWNDEFDLDRADDGDRTKPELKAKVDALWLLDGRGSYALGEVAFGRDDTWREGGEDTHEDVLELTRAFVSLRATDDVQLLAGRQDFDEEREWLYDEVLDGLRAVVQAGPCEAEVAAAIGREVAAEPNDYEDTGLLLANLRWHLDPDWLLAAYLLKRTDDSGAGFEPLLFGVRSIATPRYGLGHWVEVGAARGHAGALEVDGHAFDCGVLYTFDVAGRPSLGAGIAFASGAADGSGSAGYRQSGLQDNNGKLGGVTSVRYYGELLDPELGNLAVATVVGAVRPLPGFSISLLLHAYRQDVAATSGPDTELRTAPNGTSRDLGRELDLVLGYRLERQLTLELVGARFEPGEAFAGDDAAHLLELTARFSF